MDYYKFIRYSLKITDAYEVPAGRDWENLFLFAQHQAIIGVVFDGIERLSREGLNPPYDLLMQWIAVAMQIRNSNQFLNRKCIKICLELEGDGYKICIIKGQGNANLYPNPYSRESGDIDIIVKDVSRDNIIKYVSSRKKTGCHFQHIEFDDDGVSVELHFVPCYMNNPIYNSRLQLWFVIQSEKDNIWQNYINLPDDVGCIPIPSARYNVIYQLAHMMHHFFDEGIGLRQMMDYYYVLKRIEDPLRLPLYKGRNLEETLEYLGLRKFAGAVMYVMREVFALEVQYMIAPVDERRGKTLLNEILKGGNFGHYSGLDQKNAAKKYFQKTWRNMKLVKEYPAEALCEPLFRTWHYFWRLMHR